MTWQPKTDISVRGKVDAQSFTRNGVPIFTNSIFVGENGSPHPAEVLLKEAVWWIDAAQSNSNTQLIKNLGWGAGLDAVSGSTGSSDSNDPKHLDWDGTNYVYLPGTAGNYLSVPDESSLDITGDIDIRVKVALDDWTPSVDSTLISKSLTTPNQRSYALYLRSTGKLRLSWSTDGANSVSEESTVAPTITDGEALWARATLDVDNGAGAYEVKFYTSNDGATWTQLGSTVTGASTTFIYSSSSRIEIGTYAAGGTYPLAAKVYRAQVLDGINGITVLDADMSKISSGNDKTFTANTGQTITINRTTSGRKSAAVTQPIWLFGTDDYMQVADNDLLDFGASASFTALAVVRQWATAPSNSRILSKKGPNFTTDAGYSILYDTVVGGRLLYSDGTTLSVRDNSTGALGELQAIVAVDSGGSLTNYVNATSTIGPAPSGSLANSLNLYVGRDSSVAGGWGEFEFTAAAIFRRALTKKEVDQINDYYQTRVVSSHYGNLDANGVFKNIGIGTSNPEKPIHVLDSTNTLLALQSTDINADVVLADTGGQVAIRGRDGYLSIFTGGTGNQVEVYGSEKLRITSAGNVGVGTAEPTARLHVVQTSSSDSFRVDSVLGPTPFIIDYSGKVIMGSDVGYILDGLTQVALQIYGANTGNSSMAQILNVDGSNGPRHILAASNGTTASPTTVVNGDELGQIAFNAYDGTDYTSTGAYIQVIATGTPSSNNIPSNMIFATNSGAGHASERMRIDSSGNIGIGKSSAGSKLDVAGQIDSTHVSASGFGLRIRSVSTSNLGTLQFTNNAATAQWGTISSGGPSYMDFRTGNDHSLGRPSYSNYNFMGGIMTVRSITDAGGEVGDWPIPRLSIITKDNFTGNTVLSFQYQNDGNYTTGQSFWNFRLWGTASQTVSNSSTNLYLTGPGAFAVSSASNGVVLNNGATSWSALSDENMKTIIEPISDAVAKINTLRSVIGHYNTDTPEDRKPFLIAQDVQQVFPEAVSEAEYTQTMSTMEEEVIRETRLYLSYTDMIPLLTAAIKEMSAKIDGIEKRLSGLGV